MNIVDTPSELYFELLDGPAKALAEQLFAGSRVTTEELSQSNLGKSQIQVRLSNHYHAVCVAPWLTKLDTASGIMYIAVVPVAFDGEFAPPSNSKQIIGNELETVLRALHLNGHTTPSRISIEEETPANITTINFNPGKHNYLHPYLN